jgi:hypothetical protein
MVDCSFDVAVTRISQEVVTAVRATEHALECCVREGAREAEWRRENRRERLCIHSITSKRVRSVRSPSS